MRFGASPFLIVQNLHMPRQITTFATATPSGKMAEWSIAAVLKTVEGHTSGGSNPSLSAKSSPQGLLFLRERRDENPRVRYRAALSERSDERIPLFPQPKATKIGTSDS